MDTIAALYGSDSSDADDASDVKSATTDIAVPGLNADVAPSLDLGHGDSDRDGTPSSQSSSRKRQRVSGSPPKWTRAFAHVDGNWPSHVKVEIERTEEIERLVDRVVLNAQRLIGEGVSIIPMAGGSDDDSDLHLSLSRPFVLTYDQIDIFVGALRAVLKWRSRFQFTLDNPIVLVNDEGTRSFLALKVGSGVHYVINVIKCVDKCMREFGLQTYYKDPIPHISIASALGDSLCGAFSQTQLDQLRSEPENEEASVVVHVAAVRVIIGNKHFHIPLR